MTSTAQQNITTWAAKDGSFKRQQSTFRDHIKSSDVEKGRYMLYVSLACPWAHRTLIARKLKGLEDFIDVAIVHPFMGALGWSFHAPVRDSDGGYPQTKGEVGEPDGVKDVTGDPLFNLKFIRELYFKVDPDYSLRFTVPVLFDKKTNKIVNNESSEILRMFNTEFNDHIPEKLAKIDLYPESLRKEIDEANTWIYDTVNNGVYKSGFASKPQAYEDAVYPLFESLKRLEKMLEGKDYLVGNQLTEVDVRTFTTIVRFDPVYHYHFKCNLGTIRHDFPNLDRWQRNLYWNYPAFKETTNFEHIKKHYFMSHSQINPTRIVPVGPEPNILPL